MTRIHLIRHGTTEDNKRGIFQGSRDTDLGELGRMQAKFLADRFSKMHLDAVYTSPLKRAKETAEIIAKNHKLMPIEDARLREQNCGVLEGKSGSENRKLYNEDIYNMTFRPAFFAPPGGESSRQTYDRMVEAIKDIAADNPGKEIVVVSHGFAIQMFISYAKGSAFEDTVCEILDNASFCTFDIDDGGDVHIVSINDNAHIPEEYRFKVAKGDFMDTGERQTP